MMFLYTISLMLVVGLFWFEYCVLLSQSAFMKFVLLLFFHVPIWQATSGRQNAWSDGSFCISVYKL